MSSLEKLNQKDFEEVVFCNDESVDLKAIISVHNTVLGPGTGGVRFYDYQTEEDALNDVLRLSRGMTYKSAISRLPFGGGKSVIIGDPAKIKTEELLERFGDFVNTLKGRYICAKDVGVDSKDLRVVSRKTKHILGVEGTKNSSGNPSPATAFGVLQAIRALAKELLGRSHLDGLSFAIQGVGSVGYDLAQSLHAEGAKLTICDVSRDALNRCLDKMSPKVVSPEAIYDVKCDFFSPCAMGVVINSQTLPRLKCKIIAGAANNQLATAQDGYEIENKGIFYAPDYVINAGGIINIAEELLGYDKKRAYDHVAHIYQTMIEIIHRSKKEKKPPFVIADILAEEIIEKGRKSKAKAI
ncbi:MAG: Glu/Leu/Phe/Val dehydrogenase [Deltaproteobacteria bacterium]|nr:Glu/Leu/Phe/Val dehydrogenase [Deltaproteobacteria bacterium]